MEPIQNKYAEHTNELSQVTAEPGVSVAMMEEVPSLTVFAIIGVVVVVILTIATVFILGILIDCRQQKLMDKMDKLRKMKNKRRARIKLENDDDAIIDNAEELSHTSPPADILRTIP